jgi:hypothetical protein
VSEEAALVGQSAVLYLTQPTVPDGPSIPIEAKQDVRYVLPRTVSGKNDFTVSLRVTRPMANGVVMIKDNGRKVARKKIVRLHPAEMIRVKVKAKNIETAEKLEVSVQC